MIVRNRFKDIDLYYPLDSLEVLTELDDFGNPKTLETNFYITAVPAFFKDYHGHQSDIY